MKCPYCETEISDTVLACPACRRDLIFYTPIEKRLKLLENRVTQLNDNLRKIGHTNLKWHQEAYGRVLTNIGRRLLALWHILVLVSLYSFMHIAFHMRDSVISEAIWYGLRFPLMIPFGVWIAIKCQPSSKLFYVIPGICLGLTNALFSYAFYNYGLFEMASLIQMLSHFIFLSVGARIGGGIADKAWYKKDADILDVIGPGSSETQGGMSSKIKTVGEALAPIAGVLQILISTLLAILAFVLRKQQ